jgi:hypothetical protein
VIDPADVTAILHAAARARTALTYSEVLNALGFAFSRPKMRALCVVLDEVDAGERGAGRVPLACLVVRASDGLPGQGWWLGRRDHDAPFVGPAAAAYLAARQAEAFAHWAPGPDRVQDSALPAGGPSSPDRSSPNRSPNA